MTMTRSQKLAVALAVSLLAGCAQPPRTPAPQASATSPAVFEPVIVRLVSRQKTIVITAGHGQSLYSVFDSSGRAIVSRATLDELRAGDPTLYEMIAPGVMVWAGK
jgi:hypothetical protein